MSHLNDLPSYGTLQYFQFNSQTWWCKCECKLNRARVYMGRSPEDCQLIIHNHKVSRVHAEIFITPERGVFLRCLSSKGIIVARSTDEKLPVKIDSPPLELRNRDSIYFGDMNVLRISVSLKDISERECSEYVGSASRDQTFNYQTSSLARVPTETDDIQAFNRPDLRATPISEKPRTISLTPNINRARTASATPPSAVPFITSDGVASESVRVRKIVPVSGGVDDDSKRDELHVTAGAGSETTPIEHESPPSSQNTEKSAEPKSILRSTRKKKRRKSVRFSAFSEEASIVDAVDGSGGVTPAKTVFPPHIQKGITASRASPALAIPTMPPSRGPTGGSQNVKNVSTRMSTPFPHSSVSSHQRRFGIGQPLQSIRRSVRAQGRVSHHTATPRPAMGMYDVPLVPRSPRVFTREVPMGVCQSFKSTKLFNAITRVRQTPAKFNRLTPAKQTALDSVYRGLSHLSIHTPRVPDTPMTLDMQISPIHQRPTEPTLMEVEESEEDAAMQDLVSDMVSLLDLKGDEKQDENETEDPPQRGGFSLSFFSSLIPRLGSSQEEESPGGLSEIREILEDLPAGDENVMGALQRMANESPVDEATYQQTQASFVASHSSDTLNYSQSETIGVGTGDGASFCLGNSSDVEMPDATVVKKTYTPETDREKAKAECRQMFTALAQSLGVSVDQIPQIAAHKLEFALECLKNLVEANDDNDANVPGPQFQVNGQEAATELCQIFGTNSENMSRIVAEHLKDGLTELLEYPDHFVEVSPESRNFAIASLSEVLGAPDSAEKMSGLLVAAPKTVKSPMSVLEGVCRLTRNPDVKQSKKTVRINPNAQFHDDECEFSDVDPVNTSLASVGNMLDLSHLVNNLNDHNQDDFEEPTVALQKDLYDQFKDIEKTEYLTAKLTKQATDVEPEENSTEELVKRFDERHDSNLSGLGFTNGFQLHRPDDDETDEDLDDSLPVPLSSGSDVQRTVRSICHDANASFTTEEMSMSRKSDSFGALNASPCVPDISPALQPAREFSFLDNASSGNTAETTCRSTNNGLTERTEERLGWQPKRRLSEPIPMQRDSEATSDNSAEVMDVDIEEETETNVGRKRSRDDPETANDGPPRKRLRRASGPQPIHAHDSLSFHVPLQTSFSTTDVETENVPETRTIQPEEKELSGGSEIDEYDTEETEVDEDMNAMATVLSSEMQDNATDWSRVDDVCRGVKRGFEPESPRIGKTRLFHQDTDMDELPPCNLARSDASFCAPVQSTASTSESWCSSVTVNGFPFLSANVLEEEEEFDEPMEDEDVVPFATDEIVAVDMDEPNESRGSALTASAPLTPLKRICARRVLPFPQTSYLNRTSRMTRQWHSAQPATRTQSRIKKNAPTTPKPQARCRTSTHHARTDFVSRRRPVAEQRRKSEQVPSSLATVEEVPHAEDWSFTQEQPPVDERTVELVSEHVFEESRPATAATSDDVQREDSLPSLKESVDEEQIEPVIEEIAEEISSSVVDMDIERPVDWGTGQPASEVAKETEAETIQNEALASEQAPDERSFGAEVYSIPIVSNDSIPHNEPARASRKRSLRDVETDMIDETVNATSARDSKRRRVDTPEKVIEDTSVTETTDDIVMASAETSATVSTPKKHRRPSMSSRRAIIRKSLSEKTERKRPVVKKPVRRSLRIANRIRRQSGLPEVDHMPLGDEKQGNTEPQASHEEHQSSEDVDAPMQDSSTHDAETNIDVVMTEVDLVDNIKKVVPGDSCVEEERQMGEEQAAETPQTEPEHENHSDSEIPSVRLDFVDQEIKADVTEARIEPSRDWSADHAPLQPLETIELMSRESSQNGADSENEAPVESKRSNKSTSPLRIGGVELKHCRVVDLKKELRKRNLPDKGKKAELISRVSENMKHDVARPSTKRKTRTVRSRTQMRDLRSSQKKSSKKRVVKHVSTQPGRTRVATRRLRQTQQSEVARPPLQTVMENGRPRSMKIGGVDLNQLRVPDLRRELKNRHLDSSGKKVDLIARLEAHLRSAGGRSRRS